MAVDVIDRAGFEREVLEGSNEQPVVVDFWAPWCQPCRVLGPILERMAEGDAGRWKLVKVDVQAHPELAQSFQVEGIPAVFGFRDGKLVDRFTGAMPPAKVRRWLDRLIPSLADEAVASAALAQQRGDRELARAELARALTLQGDHPGALLGLAELDPTRATELLRALPPTLPPELAARRARVLLGLEAAGADPAALDARLAADPGDLDARWQRAHARAVAGELAAAGGDLLDLVRRDRKYRDDGARKALLSLFDLAGPDSPVTEHYRRELSRLLF